MHIDIHMLRSEIQADIAEIECVLGQMCGVERVQGFFERRTMHKSVVDEKQQRSALGVVVCIRDIARH